MKESIQRKTPGAEQTGMSGTGKTMAPPAFALGGGETVQRAEDNKAGTEDKVAKIHIHADIDAESMGIGELLNGAVGHAWVSLEWNDPTKVPDSVKTAYPDHAGYLQGRAAKGMFADPMGFWPYMFSSYDAALDEWSSAPDRVGYSSNPFNSYVKGQVVHPDTLHEKSVRATQSFDITEKQALDVMAYGDSKKGADYSVFFYNCTTFAKEAVEAAGKTPPSSTTLGIAYPNALYDSIVKNQKKKEGNTTVRDTTGTATNVVGEEAKKNR